MAGFNPIGPGRFWAIADTGHIGLGCPIALASTVPLPLAQSRRVRRPDPGPNRSIGVVPRQTSGDLLPLLRAKRPARSPSRLWPNTPTPVDLAADPFQASADLSGDHVQRLTAPVPIPDLRLLGLRHIRPSRHPTPPGSLRTLSVLPFQEVVH